MCTSARSRVTPALAILLLLGSCRPDSLTLPHVEACGARTSCAPARERPPASAATASVRDAVERVLPSLDDGAARTALDPALRALAADLAAGRDASARVGLAEAYRILAELGRSRAGAPIHPDAPTVAALRLALVPAAARLEVAAP